MKSIFSVLSIPACWMTLAWRQHDGGHTDAPNMKYFILWANKFLDYSVMK